MRPICEIAADIKKAWPRPYFGAVPYLDAMLGISGANDKYGADSAKNIVAYFLSNASSFKGDTARALKAELKQAVKGAK